MYKFMLVLLDRRTQNVANALLVIGVTLIFLGLLFPKIEPRDWIGVRIDIPIYVYGTAILLFAGFLKSLEWLRKDRLIGGLAAAFTVLVFLINTAVLGIHPWVVISFFILMGLSCNAAVTRK